MFSSLRIFLSLISTRDKKWIVIFAVSSVFSGILETITIGLLIPVVTLSMGTKAYTFQLLDDFFTFLGYSSLKDGIIILAGGLLFLFIIKNIFSIFLEWGIISYIYFLERSIGERLFKNYLNCPYSFKIDKQTSKLLNNVIRESSTLSLNYILPIIQVLSQGIIVLFLFAFMIFLDPLLFTTVSFIIIILFYSFNHLSKTRMKAKGQLVQQWSVVKNESVMTAFYGFKETKIFNSQSFFLNQYHQSARIVARSQSFLVTIAKSSKFFLEIGLVFTILSLLIVAIKSNEAQKFLINISVFGVSLFRLLPSLTSIFNNIALMNYGRTSLNLIAKEFGDTLHPIHKTADSKKDVGETKRLIFKHHIQLKEVFFAYEGRPNKWILENINLTINKNEMIAFIGASGGGKTTLVDIIIGLLTPTKGQIFIDNEALKGREQHWWPNIGYVPQQIYLLNGTIKQNIAFGIAEKDIDIHRLEEVIHMANLEEVISHLDKGYMTKIGENGVELSGGQRQRVGIARALYHQPNLLVLDEATAALDNISEREIIKAISTIAEKKTVIIIAHRLSTIEKCNRIYVMDSGSIVDQGTFQQLAENSKIVKKMLNHA